MTPYLRDTNSYMSMKVICHLMLRVTKCNMPVKVT